MRPIDPAGDPPSAELPADVVVPAQALAHGGTIAAWRRRLGRNQGRT